MQKKNHHENFTPFQTSKISDPPFFDIHIMGQPNRKSYKLN